MPPIKTWLRKISAALLLLASLPLSAQVPGPQSDADATAILTTGQWRVLEGGRMVLRAFNPDGTFTSTPDQPFQLPGSSPATPAPAATPALPDGAWNIAHGKIILVFSSDQSEQEIDLPINPRFARLIDQTGMPMMMMKVQAPPPRSPAQPIPAAIHPFPTPLNLSSTPAPTVSADDQHSASQLIQSHPGSLVFVNGKQGAGSGFIASIGKSTFLVTNIHVVAGLRDAAFKTLDGTPVRGGAASAAIGEDIFCFALPQDGNPFPVMQNVDANAAIGDSVVVLGNAEGQGVVNTLIGKIVGIGPNLVEIDAPFVPGNSGSPIIHLKTGQVIGVATYLVTNRYDLTTSQRLTQPVIRRFGYRLDTVKGWQPVDWPAFAAQALDMQAIESLTSDLYDFFRDLGEHNGAVTPGRHTNPIIKDRIDDWIDAKSHNHSYADRAQADANLISFLKIACQSDIPAAQRQISYDYFARGLADQQQTRAGMVKAFQQILHQVQP
jgi:S1-C subfamily serine protease